MFKTLPMAVFVTVMSFLPAYAAGECTEAHMKQMDGMIAKNDRCRKEEGSDDASRHVEGRDEEGQ